MNLKKGLVTTLAFASLTTYLFVTSTAAPGAEWKKNDKGWWYEEADGSYPTNAWKLIKDKWYYFDNVDDLIGAEGITDVLFLYNANTFFADDSLRMMLNE